MKLDDLLAAFDWVNSGRPRENSAFISRETGATHWASDSYDLEDELPDDIEDGSIYIAVPHKHDLDLGNALALAFAEDRAPQAYDIIAGFFRHKGAYGRFKDFLERNGLLQDWYDYEASAVERALRAWCDENGVDVTP